MCLWPNPRDLMTKFECDDVIKRTKKFRFSVPFAFWMETKFLRYRGKTH